MEMVANACELVKKKVRSKNLPLKGRLRKSPSNTLNTEPSTFPYDLAP